MLVTTAQRIEQLPKYLWYHNKRSYLTICTTIQGRWNIGYSPDGHLFMPKPIVGDSKSLEQALYRIEQQLKQTRKNS